MKNKLLVYFLISVILLTLCSFSALADESEPENVLEGKSVLFVGDSITEAIIERSNKENATRYGWASRVGEYNNMKWQTTGYSGASVSDCRGDNTILRQLKSKSAYDYDIVIMHGGVNDAWDSARIGQMSDSFDPKDFDFSTFAGGLEITLQYAKETYPNAQFGYIINFSMPKATYGRLSDMTAYVNMTKKICEKWGVPYLDMYNDKELNDALETATSTKYLHDHIHPNTAGYEIIYPVVETWMKDLMTPAEPEPEPESEPESEEPVSEIVSEPEKEEPAADIASIVVASISIILILGSVVVLILFLKKSKK